MSFSPTEVTHIIWTMVSDTLDELKHLHDYSEQQSNKNLPPYVRLIHQSYSLAMARLAVRVAQNAKISVPPWATKGNLIDTK